MSWPQGSDYDDLVAGSAPGQAQPEMRSSPNARWELNRLTTGRNSHLDVLPISVSRGPRQDEEGSHDVGLARSNGARRDGFRHSEQLQPEMEGPHDVG